VPLIVDNTIATPILLKPFDYSASAPRARSGQRRKCDR